MSFISMSNPRSLLFDDEPIESILYGERSREPSSASLFGDARLHLDEIEATLSMDNFERGFELLGAYLHGDEPIPASACAYILRSLRRLIPLFPRPNIPQLVIQHIDVAHSLIALAQQYRMKKVQHLAETITYRWHEARGEYAEARAILAPMRNRAIAEGDELTIGVLTNNHAYEHLLEHDYQAAEDGFREALRLFERTGNKIEIVNARANILTSRLGILPEDEWVTLLPELKEIHRELIRRRDWRARKTMVIFAKRAAARGRLSSAIGWARRAAAASSKIPTLLHSDDQKYVSELQQLKSTTRLLERPDTAASDHNNGTASHASKARKAGPRQAADAAKSIMGLETEYAFTAFDRNGRPLDRTEVSQRLVSLGPQHFATLHGRDDYDLYLENGGRLYVDSGLGLINTEYATPECSSPAELVAHVNAGDRILARLAIEFEKSEATIGEAFISKCNFDYSGTTSGSHENYLHTASQAKLANELIPHLVSRIIYTGGGGFNDKTSHVEFMVSPRVRFLEHVVSKGQQEARAIFTTKVEPLSRSRFGRLQLLCGEGVRYETAEYLRFGVTALLIKFVDLGFDLAAGIELDPLRAMNACARDTKCRALIAQIDGRAATALDIQRHYLGRAEKFLKRSDVPDWASAVCDRWARVLDQLSTDPMQLTGTLDWPTKLRLYQSFAAQRGRDWETLSHQTKKAPDEIRAALFEFDIRFGDVSDESIFSLLTRTRRAEQSIVDEADIERALTAPPRETRARLRGDWIKKLSRNPIGIRCDWSSVRDRSKGEVARFDDPFGSRLVG